MSFFKSRWTGVFIVAFLLSSAAVKAADVQVIDGGALFIEGAIVRLWAVEAPGASQTCTTTAGRVWPCGQRVRSQLRALMEEDLITCEPKAPGFAVCRVASLDVGLLLIKEGLAKARGDYLETEARARQARVGIWE